MIQKLWDEEYKPIESPSLSINKVTSLQPSTKRRNRYEEWSHQYDLVNESTDEYTKYLKAELVIVSNSLAWWLEPTQQENYPNLSKMAIDFLTIPAMSAAPERIFSGAKLTITEKRFWLSPEIIEAFECLKSWYKINEWIPPSYLEELQLAVEEADKAREKVVGKATARVAAARTVEAEAEVDSDSEDLYGDD